MKNDNNSNINLWAKYIEGKLDPKEKIQFEKSLAKSPKKLDYLLDLKKDLLMMGSIPLNKTPQELLAKVTSQSKKKQIVEDNNWGELTLNFIQKGFEIIKDTFSLESPKTELLAYRSDVRNRIKSILNNDLFELSLLPISVNEMNIEIIFNDPIDSSQWVDLYLIQNDDTKMIASNTITDNKVQFNNLPLENYIIEVFQKKLVLNINSDS